MSHRTQVRQAVTAYVGLYAAVGPLCPYLPIYYESLGFLWAPTALDTAGCGSGARRFALAGVASAFAAGALAVVLAGAAARIRRVGDDTTATETS